MRALTKAREFSFKGKKRGEKGAKIKKNIKGHVNRQLRRMKDAALSHLPTLHIVVDDRIIKKSISKLHINRIYSRFIFKLYFI